MIVNPSVMAKVSKLGDVSVADTLDLEDYTEEDSIKRKIAGKALPPNHVLLFTVINPYYPITVDVIHSICKSYGSISRIVIFRKNGVQAMVEVDSVETAEKMKEDLNERDIYAGCCKLKVDFARPARLNVLRNNSESWDYTQVPAVGETTVSDESGSGLLCFPKDVESDETVGYCGVDVPPREEDACLEYSSYNPQYEDYSEYGCVVMAYNLDEKRMNPDGVFNLLCMFGNVVKVKFLKSKKGCAMVQMGDRQGAERCLAYLEGLPLFGSSLQLNISKQPFLNGMGRGFELPDGSYSWKDFSKSKNNRFLTPEMASKNRLNYPSKVLHFFNMPPNLTEDRLENFVKATARVDPFDLTIFSNRSDKSASGLMEFECIADAVACIVLCNNFPLQGTDSGPPFFIKLCFSSVTSIAVAEQLYEKRYMKYEKTDWL